MLITTCYNLFMTWQEWITAKYLEWRHDKPGHAGSMASYAREIKVTSQLLNEWINRGKVPTDFENIHKLIDYYGPVIYEVLNVPPPEINPLDQLPPELRSRFSTAILEIAQELNARSLDTESPEAAEISRDILSKYGLIVKSIDSAG